MKKGKDKSITNYEGKMTNCEWESIDIVKMLKFL